MLSSSSERRPSHFALNQSLSVCELAAEAVFQRQALFLIPKRKHSQDAAQAVALLLVAIFRGIKRASLQCRSASLRRDPVLLRCQLSSSRVHPQTPASTTFVRRPLEVRSGIFRGARGLRATSALAWLAPPGRLRHFGSGLWDQGVYPHFCDTRESPLYMGSWSLGAPFCCITEVVISHSPVLAWADGDCGCCNDSARHPESDQRAGDS